METSPAGGEGASRTAAMAQRLHLVFGGELVSPEKNVFRDVNKIHIVGMFPDYETAFLAWKAEVCASRRMTMPAASNPARRNISRA